MAKCMQDTVEYQSLKDKTGVHPVVLTVACKNTLQELGRYPHLDEIPGSNSEEYLKKELKIKKNGSTKISHILETTNTEDLQRASQKLNDDYRDKEIKITPLVDDAIIDITTRPTTFPSNFDENVLDPNVSGSLVIQTALNKLANIYGIKINEVTDAELATEQWNDLMPKDKMVNGFIYNGEIYLNTDKASPDTKIHEMLHLLVGSMRFSNPQLYLQLIMSAEQLPNYEYLISEFQNRSRNDVNEEVIIQELAKHFAGLKSDLDGLDYKTKYEITYNVRRVLDSMLMGSVSTKTISDQSLFNLTLRQLVQATNSNIMTNNFHGFLDYSEIHRKVNNIKSDLLRKGELIENCD